MSCVLSFLGESSKMWQLLTTLSCLVVLTSARNRPNFPPLSDELVNYVNKRNTTWKVGCGGCFPACVPSKGRSVHPDSQQRRP